MVSSTAILDTSDSNDTNSIIEAVEHAVANFECHPSPRIRRRGAHFGPCEAKILSVFGRLRFHSLLFATANKAAQCVAHAGECFVLCLECTGHESLKSFRKKESQQA